MKKFRQMLVVALNMAVLGTGCATDPKSSFLNNNLSGLDLAFSQMGSVSQSFVAHYVPQTRFQEHLLPSTLENTVESNDSWVSMIVDIIARERSYLLMRATLVGKR